MKNKSELQVGVAGTGFIGPVHVEALRRLGIAIAGIQGSTPERAAEKAKALSIGKVYESYEEMLADPKVDVVHITSPNHLHHAHAKAALLARKHVVCEKPLAMTSSEAAELKTLAKKSRLVNAVNFNVRFYPLCQQARAALWRGDLGDLFIVQGSYLQDWLLYPTDWSWRLEPELGGELRAVADIGSHWLDLMTFITGRRVESVCADFKTFLPVREKPLKPADTFTGKLSAPAGTEARRIRTEDFATVLLRFEGGARGAMTVSQVSAGRKNRLFFELNGSKSSMAWDSERPNELWIGHRERPNERLLKDPSLLLPEARQFVSYPGGHNEGFPDTFKQLYGAIYRFIASGNFEAEPGFPTFEDGHYELVLCEAIHRSAREQCWVRVESKGETQ